MPLRYALLFPGQGAQFVGMGKELADAFPEARALFQEADRILSYSLSSLCWNGPFGELTRTEHCQPALYVTSMAALTALASEGRATNRQLSPTATAGLSLGEYTALAAAGAFSFGDGLRLVRLRGQAMEEAALASRGTMASILGLGVESVKELCTATGAQVANINSPGQIVISGPVEAVQAASREALGYGAKRVVPLEVGGAFHSRLMEPAARRLEEALRSVQIRQPQCPVASNVTGSTVTDPSQIRRLLVQQLTHPVQWEACMRTLLAAGIQTFLEVGAGTVLKGLMRKIDSGAQVLPVGNTQEVCEVATTLTAL